MTLIFRPQLCDDCFWIKRLNNTYGPSRIVLLRLDTGLVHTMSRRGIGGTREAAEFRERNRRDGGSGGGEGEGERDSMPLLKSARVAGVLLCYGAALDGDPREDQRSTHADLGEEGVAAI